MSSEAIPLKILLLSDELERIFLGRARQTVVRIIAYDCQGKCHGTMALSLCHLGSCRLQSAKVPWHFRGRY